MSYKTTPSPDQFAYHVNAAEAALDEDYTHAALREIIYALKELCLPVEKVNPQTTSIQTYIRQEIERARGRYVNSGYSNNEHLQYMACATFKALRGVALQLSMDVETVKEFMASR